MAYTPIPNIVTVHTPKISSNQSSMNSLTEVLQSESVKRLLNRQNVYLQTPLTDDSIESDLASLKNSFQEKPNGSLNNEKVEKYPELSLIPIMSLESKEESMNIITDDNHLLPSKSEGKSSIALLPLTQETKECGHSEPCENLVCDVNFQRLVEGEDILPLVAVNIESSEIDAPVSKHCNSDECDALSIDHDRCRRAMVRCHRCDSTKVCDICLKVLKTRKSQMMHKTCRMRVEYRHNKTSRSQLMKDRMRVRELQILDSVKFNKNDYTDPVTGPDRAMRRLQKNTEIIVTAMPMPLHQDHPTIRISSVTGSALHIYNGDEFSETESRYSNILSACKSIVSRNSTSVDSTDYDSSLGTSMNQDESSFSAISQQANEFISIGQTGTQSVDLNGFMQSQSQSNLTSSIQPAHFLLPIRVLPITGLRTEPSLLHQTQGIPKFCIVAQSSNQSATSENIPRKILPAENRQQQQINNRVNIKPTDNLGNKILRRNESSAEFVLKRFKSGVRRGRRKKNVPKRGSKSFECTFCFKRFSTDWYFKLHIAKHKGEIKFTCKYCKKPFMHHYNMTKHIVTMHKQEYANEESIVDEENVEFLHCSSCKVIFKTQFELDNHRCPIMCLRCHSRIADGDLILHLKIKHEMSETRAFEEFERQRKKRIIIAQNRAKKRREMEKEHTRGARIKDETRERHVERENGATKRKRSSLISTDVRGLRDNGSNDQISMKSSLRRLRRRRNHNLVNQLETVSTNKILNENCEDEPTSGLEMTSISPETNLISR